MRRFWRVVPVTCLLFPLSACEPVATPLSPQRVEIPALEIAFSDIPRACEVESEEGSELALTCVVDGQQGRLTALVGEPERVDLRQSARNQQERFERLPDGAYHGMVELVTPTGPAFTSRGRYRLEGAPVEEMQVHILHPAPPPRELLLRYVYPEGDRDQSQARRDHLLFLTGELEGLEPEGS